MSDNQATSLWLITSVVKLIMMEPSLHLSTQCVETIQSTEQIKSKKGAAVVMSNKTSLFESVYFRIQAV